MTVGGVDDFDQAGQRILLPLPVHFEIAHDDPLAAVELEIRFAFLVPDECRAAAVEDEIPHPFEPDRPIGGHPVGSGSDGQFRRPGFPAVFESAVQRIDVVGRVGGEAEGGRLDDGAARIRRRMDRKLLRPGRQRSRRIRAGGGVRRRGVVIFAEPFDQPEIGDFPLQLPVGMDLERIVRGVPGAEFDPDRPEGGAVSLVLPHRVECGVSGGDGPAEEVQELRIHIGLFHPAAEGRDVGGGRFQHAGIGQENRIPLVFACRRVDPQRRAVRRQGGERLLQRAARGVGEILQDDRFAGGCEQRGTGDQGGDDLSGHGLLSVFDGEAWVFIKILPGLRNASIFRANFPVRGRMA